MSESVELDWVPRVAAAASLCQAELPHIKGMAFIDEGDEFSAGEGSADFPLRRDTRLRRYV